MSDCAGCTVWSAIYQNVSISTCCRKILISKLLLKNFDIFTFLNHQSDFTNESKDEHYPRSGHLDDATISSPGCKDEKVLAMAAKKQIWNISHTHASSKRRSTTSWKMLSVYHNLHYRTMHLRAFNGTSSLSFDDLLNIPF